MNGIERSWSMLDVKRVMEIASDKVDRKTGQPKVCQYLQDGWILLNMYPQMLMYGHVPYQRVVYTLGLPHP